MARNPVYMVAVAPVNDPVNDGKAAEIKLFEHEYEQTAYAEYIEDAICSDGYLTVRREPWGAAYFSNGAHTVCVARDRADLELFGLTSYAELEAYNER